jgi:hypothetical protein
MKKKIWAVLKAKGHSADTGAGKFPLVSMGAEQRVSRAQTRERGPPSALAVFSFLLNACNLSLCIWSVFTIWYNEGRI